jgi:hypothetical protein
MLTLSLIILSIAADHWRSRKSRVIPAPIVVWLEQKTESIIFKLTMDSPRNEL